MAEAVESLSGVARLYADAFSSIDTLIARAGSDVFGQLAAYGNPKRLRNIRDIDFEPGESRSVHFTVEDEILPETGLLVWTDDTLLQDALLIEGMNVSFEEDAGVELRMTGVILAGSRAAWSGLR
ncbi:hypothetical protein GCM10010212_36010 [Paenarthrobacter nicotinovorans]|nr:hypothetical protein GCM10010212_36010 [Paenarthrobacter nicotinovorans]